MRKIFLGWLFLFFILTNGCKGTTDSETDFSFKNSLQDTIKDLVVGGLCDRCDKMFYGGKPLDDSIKNEVTIASKDEPGDRLNINGTVVLQDGTTPARKIVLYIYHTDARGLYSPTDTQTVIRFNGHLRNWIKTDAEGKFTIHSIRPAPYPSHTMPAHIHILVKEPGKIPYYIDEVWFDDDTLITKTMRDKSEKRGGNLIIHLAKNENRIWTGNLKIVLGFNIPDYK